MHPVVTGAARVHVRAHDLASDWDCRCESRAFVVPGPGLGGAVDDRLGSAVFLDTLLRMHWRNGLAGGGSSTCRRRGRRIFFVDGAPGCHLRSDAGRAATDSGLETVIAVFGLDSLGLRRPWRS